MTKNSGLGKVAYILLIIGGINWGLVGLFKFDVVELIFGGMPALAMIVYVLIGLSGLYMLFGCCGSSCKR
ncbi:DUF378 domain-containing protein [Candidatus Gracilibacteria bacterium]|nr:DUF378 domain-containing protein [Candidatus Gracilibacteria bacterium]